MAIIVNIPGTATATMNENNELIISLQVQILNNAVVIEDKIITISVFRYTANVLNYAVTVMINEIAQYKALCIKNLQIQTALSTFTSLVKAGV